MLLDTNIRTLKPSSLDKTVKINAFKHLPPNKRNKKTSNKRNKIKIYYVIIFQTLRLEFATIKPNYKIRTMNKTHKKNKKLNKKKKKDKDIISELICCFCFIPIVVSYTHRSQAGNSSKRKRIHMEQYYENELGKQRATIPTP